MSTQTAENETAVNAKKIIRFEVKQIGPEGDRVLRFTGTDETPDRDRDIIRVAGWDFSNYLKNPVFLPFHNYWTIPVGKCVNLGTDSMRKGVFFDIKFPTIEELSSDPSNPSNEAKLADAIYMAYKNGYLNAVSVGFRGLKSKIRDDDAVLDLPDWQRGREFLSQELLELSAVAVPANANAIVQMRSAKGFSADAIDFLQREAKQFASEIDLVEEDMTKADVEGMIKTAIDAAVGEIKTHLENTVQAIKGIKPVVQPVINVSEKGNRRLSKTSLARIEKSMASLKEATRHAKECEDELKALVSDGVEEPDEDDSSSGTSTQDDDKGIDLDKINFEKLGQLATK